MGNKKTPTSNDAPDICSRKARKFLAQNFLRASPSLLPRFFWNICPPQGCWKGYILPLGWMNSFHITSVEYDHSSYLKRRKIPNALRLCRSAFAFLDFHPRLNKLWLELEKHTMNNNAKTYPKNLKAELLTLCRKDKDLRDKIINTIPQQKFSDLLDAHMTQYNGDEHVVFAGTVLFPDGDTEVVLTTEGGLKTYITRRMRPGGLAKYEPVKTGSKLLRI